jgi:hypothetical protein
MFPLINIDIMDDLVAAIFFYSVLERYSANKLNGIVELSFCQD